MKVELLSRLLMMSKKVLLFLMCCAMFTASCSEKKKELTPGERMEAEYKYDKLPDSEKSKIKFLKYEHDFGKVVIAGVSCFWKIDYYDHTMTYGSEDPANPDITTRVLTIMQASEY